MSRVDTLNHERTDSGTTTERGCLRWPGMSFEKGDVLSLGVDATCWTMRGDLWEFVDAVFFLTDLRGDRQRRRVWDESLVPQGPWHHHDDCDCEVCRLGSA